MRISRLALRSWPAWAVFAAAAPVLAAERPEPIIDMHVHGSMTARDRPVEGCPGDQPILYLPVDPVKAPANAPVISCPRPILSATNVDELRTRTIGELRRWGVVRAVLLGKLDDLDRWSRDAPGMFIPASIPRNLSELPQLAGLLASGKIRVLGETGMQYEGCSADDPALEPFWAIAERYDAPVGMHLGEGMPLAGADITDRYRAALTSPFQLEAVLKKHPKLRIYVMHAASPLTDEMIAMLLTYPSIYVDISANDWNMPRAQFYDQLKRMVDAGFSKRILFGSDQTLFPQAIGLAIATIEEAPFLTAEQKRDILYNNAARFLRLTPEEIARDHRP